MQLVEVHPFRNGVGCKHQYCTVGTYNPDQASWFGRSILTWNVNYTEGAVIPPRTAEPDKLAFFHHDIFLRDEYISDLLAQSTTLQQLPMYLRGDDFGTRYLNTPCFNNECTDPTEEDLLAKSRGDPSSS